MKTFVITIIFLAICLLFIVLFFIKKIFKYLCGTKFSVVKLELMFFITFLIYNSIYLAFVFVLCVFKNNLCFFPNFIVDQNFLRLFFIEVYSTRGVYFLLVFLSFSSSYLLLFFNIFKEYDKDKLNRLFYFFYFFLIYFLYWFVLFAFTFFFLIAFK